MAGADPKRLRQARIAAAMTLEQISEITGISAGAISNWENGNRELRDIEKIRRLAAAYHVYPAWLAGFSDIERPLSQTERQIIKAYRALPGEAHQWFFTALLILLG